MTSSALDVGRTGLGMRRLVTLTLGLSLLLGPAGTLAADEETPPTGAFSPAGTFYDFTRQQHVPVLLGDGRVLILPVAARAAEVWDPDTSSFSPAGALPKARHSYSATALPDGRVLVVGGEGRRRLLADAKLWEPTTVSFSPAGNLATARRDHDAVLLPDGRVLVVGGCCDARGRDIAEAEVWDPAGRRFQPAGSMRGRREGHTVTLLPDGRVLVIGGYGVPPAGRSAEIWDPATNDFSPAGTTLQRRIWHDAVALPDGRVLVTDGESKVAEVWDPGTMSFTPAGAFAEQRMGFTSTLLPDGRVLYVGGAAECDEETGECALLASAEVWDPTAMAFSPAGEMARGRDGASAALLPDGRVLVFGGGEDEAWTVPASAEVWDPVTSTFSPAGVFDRVRLDHGHVALPDGRVLVTGGHAGMTAGSANDALIWDPGRSEPGPPVPPPVLDQATTEAMLLSRIRASIRDACRPLRRNLPEGAVAGLDCPLADPVVKRVRALLFREQADMLDAYFARLADVGLDRMKSHNGACRPDRPSEGPYHPTRSRDRAEYPFRDACFFDASGRARYLSTSPPYVLSEVTGRGDDLGVVRGWAWAGGGGDVPGGPRVTG